MKEIRAAFEERIRRTQSVQSFRFLPEERIAFTAGQFLQVIFDEANRSNKELNKYLSFSSSPAKEYIEVTKRISSSIFSQRLESLQKGERVLLRAPLGNCIFLPEEKKIAFLIGGIGITPVISIFGYITEQGLDNQVALFYSNRTEEEIAFKSELDRWQSAHCNIKVFYTVTECRPKDRACMFGVINKEILTANLPDFRERVFYIFGPPRMVEAMQGLCLELGVAPERIKTESFIGY